MNYRKIIQQSINDMDESYTLKTNSELIDYIIDYGCGETEFHTADIERLLKEHAKLLEITEALIFALSIDGKRDSANKNLLELANNAIQLYKN